MKTLRVVFAGVAFVLSAVASADVYQWKEGKGRVAYGDHYPPGVTATRISAGGGARPGPVPAAAIQPAPTPTAGPASASAPAVAQAKAARNQEQCASLRGRLAELDARAAAQKTRDASNERSHGEPRDTAVALGEQRRALQLQMEIACQPNP
ncbi:DUF4124 domain-containing protein [Paludibacterium paludis]|uniref:DUF4124 domain-containing protein n=1 Tax=Paludibacterium paludis TaxID=1225769 RepID=A0A918NXY2_9NEIS|nr:DUF4124 domain-containing protein [Paludibacterium paludis]GGY04268.1 hypothetical protein GCM10011289_03430 [Paludibacterium paludis]